MRTPGTRVGVNSVSRVRISLSPPFVKLLEHLFQKNSKTPDSEPYRLAERGSYTFFLSYCCAFCLDSIIFITSSYEGFKAKSRVRFFGGRSFFDDAPIPTKSLCNYTVKIALCNDRKSTCYLATRGVVACIVLNEIKRYCFSQNQRGKIKKL